MLPVAVLSTSLPLTITGIPVGLGSSAKVFSAGGVVNHRATLSKVPFRVSSTPTRAIATTSRRPKAQLTQTGPIKRQEPSDRSFSSIAAIACPNAQEMTSVLYVNKFTRKLRFEKLSLLFAEAGGALRGVYWVNCEPVAAGGRALMADELFGSRRRRQMVPRVCAGFPACSNCCRRKV